MKKLSIVLVAITAFVALGEPVFAASRARNTVGYGDVNTVRTYGDRDPTNPPWGHPAGFEAYARATNGAFARSGNGSVSTYSAPGTLGVNGAAAEQNPYGRGQNLPYPDRPYGDPDSW